MTVMLSSITLDLVDFSDHVLASTDNFDQANDGIVFMPSVLNVSNAGEYMCVAMVQDTAGKNGYDSQPIDLIIGRKLISLHMYVCACTCVSVCSIR